MLKMRLQRVGRKHEPSFRLVLTDSKNSTKSGRFKEILGSYDPRKTTDLLKIDRIKHWLSQGVIPTDSVHNLLVTHNIIEGKKKNVLPKKTPIIKETPVEESSKVEAVPEPAAAEESVAPVEDTVKEVKEPETVNEPTVEAPAEAPSETPASENTENQ